MKKFLQNLIRLSAIGLIVLLFFLCLQAQTKKKKQPRWNWEKHQSEVIDYAKKYLVSEIESNVPPLSFEKWFQETVGKDSTIEWEIDDCGEQTGTSADRGRDFPMCVSAMISKPEFIEISVDIQFGTFKSGINNMKPVVRSIVASDEIGSEWVENLSDLSEVLKLQEKTRRYFNPNRGSFQLSNEPPLGFEKFSEMWVHTAEFDEKGKYVPITANGGILIGETFYKINNYYSDRINWKLETMKINGVSFKFEGTFAKLNFESDGHFSTDNILQGHLIKLVNGKKTVEADLSFNFIVKRPCKGCGQPPYGKKP